MSTCGFPALWLYVFLYVGPNETKSACKRSPTERFFSNDVSEESDACNEEDDELELLWTSALKL